MYMEGGWGREVETSEQVGWESQVTAGLMMEVETGG